ARVGRRGKPGEGRDLPRVRRRSRDVAVQASVRTAHRAGHGSRPGRAGRRKPGARADQKSAAEEAEGPSAPSPCSSRTGNGRLPRTAGSAGLRCCAAGRGSPWGPVPSRSPSPRRSVRAAGPRSLPGRRPRPRAAFRPPPSGRGRRPGCSPCFLSWAVRTARLEDRRVSMLTSWRAASKPDGLLRHVFSRGLSARHGWKTVGFRCCPPGGPGLAPSRSSGRILAERDRVGERTMGGTVDFYVRDFPGLVRLSVAAARAFRSPALMAGAEEARFSVDLEALVGAPGSAEVTVEELLDESGEGEEMFSGTVLESCRYEISVEFSRRTEAEAPGQGRSIGRKLFQRLVALNTPMVYAVRDAEALAAEFSPENGVRDFTPPVDITVESLKAESVLSSPVPRSSPGKPGPTAANVS